MKLNKGKNEFGTEWLRTNLFKNENIIEKEINKYITLKLVGGRTYIYVNGRRFIQCIRLILNIPKSDVHLYDEIDSIDEAAKLYSRHVFQNRIVRGPMAARIPNQNHDITPEQEFWGHCSNIQAWVEHDYDTRILMSNIAFPLLRELTRAGDPLASKVFKEEIALRLESGYPSVVQYLLNQGYIRYFTADEFKSIIESTEIIKGLSSSPKMLSRFLVACGLRFPTVVKDILTQVFKLPEGKNIIISSMNISERSPIMPFLRTSFRPSSQYLLTLKIALHNLLIEADIKLGEDIIDCIHEIESKFEGMTLDALSIRAREKLDIFEEFYLENMVLGNLKNKEHLPLAEKFLGEVHKFRSKCPYCGKEIPRGQITCTWCGHRKDDKGWGGFFPYPYIFKPPGGGGSMKGTIAVAVKTKSQT
jgi:hypothetical protein